MAWVTDGVMIRSWLFFLPVLLTLLLACVAGWVVHYLGMISLEKSQAALEAESASVATMLAGDERLIRELGSDRTLNYFSLVASERPVLDGKTDDWSQTGEALASDDAEQTLAYTLRIKGDSEFLFLHYEVKDDSIVYREINHPSVHRNDHIQIGLIDNEGTFRRFTIAAVQPGHIEAEEINQTGRALRRIEMMSGRWLATGSGYNVEIQIPRTIFYQRFSTVVTDVDDEVTRRVVSTLGKTGSSRNLGNLINKPTPLERLIEELPHPAGIVSANGLLNLQSSSFHTMSSAGGYQEASAGIFQDGVKLGDLTMRAQIIPLFGTNQQIGLGVLAAVVLIFVILASSFAWRWQRVQALRSEQESDRILKQNEYLERMASRLNHELQTPVSVIRSSLEHLQAGEGEPRTYVDRASEGLRRLANILDKMAEARRLEEALDEDEITRFNLTEVVSGCVEGYRLAFTGVEFEMMIETDDVPVTGIPELFAQCLDKIVDNAVEFAADNRVRVRLNVEDGQAMLRIMNEGPVLPDGSASEALFESMVSHRESGDHHLGLGLFVAQKVIQFHGGQIHLRNREDTQGVIAVIQLPILRVTSRLS